MKWTTRLKERLRRWLNTPTDGPRSTQQVIYKDNSLYVAALRQQLAEVREVEIPVRGWSMRIFVEHERDKAILTLCQPERLKVNDVILAQIEAPTETYVLHRIIRADGDRLTLMGDGNLRGTETCRRQDVVAQVIAFRRADSPQPDYLTGRKWRIYSWWWTRLRPIRRPLILVWRLLRRLHIIRL